MKNSMAGLMQKRKLLLKLCDIFNVPVSTNQSGKK